MTFFDIFAYAINYRECFGFSTFFIAKNANNLIKSSEFGRFISVTLLRIRHVLYSVYTENIANVLLKEWLLLDDIMILMDDTSV